MARMKSPLHLLCKHPIIYSSPYCAIEACNDLRMVRIMSGHVGHGSEYIIIIYPFAVGILRRLAPFIGEDKFGIRVGINFEIKKYIFLNSDSCSQCVI